MTVCLRITALLTLVVAGSAATAHPVSVSRTLVVLSNGSAAVTIDVFLEDLYLFHNLQSRTGRISSKEIARGIDAHRKFVAERFRIRRATGDLLKADSVTTVRFQIPENGVSVDELMKHRLTFEFNTRLDESDNVLTFEQSFSGPGGVLPAEMQLTVIQERGQLFEGQLEEEHPRTIRFDQANAPPAGNTADNLRQAWLKRRDEAAFGITSFSTVYAFLYLEPQQARLEVLIPLSTLNDAVPVSRVNPDTVTVAEQAAVKPAVVDWLRQGVLLHQGGQLLTSRTERCDVYGADLKDFALRPPAADVAFSSGRVGLIQTWPMPNEDCEITLTWNSFSNAFRGIRLVVINDSDREDPVSRVPLTATGDRNSWTWQFRSPTVVTPQRFTSPEPWYRETRIPTLSGIMVVCALFVSAIKGLKPWHRLAGTLSFLASAIALIGAPGRIVLPHGHLQLAEEEYQEVLTALLTQTYTAVSTSDEEQAYDALVFTTDENLTQEIYLSLVEGIRPQNDTGAIARINHVTVEQASPITNSELSSGTLAARVRWVVSGTVEHWGHLHERTNQFAADVEIEWTKDGWKMTALEIVDEAQVSSSLQLRQFDRDD